MPLFLVTRVGDEGVSQSSFRLVEAPSRWAVAENLVRDPYRWRTFLERSHFWEQVRDRGWSPDEFLSELGSSHVDGDSRDQLAIPEITKIEPCESRGTPGLHPMSYQKFDLNQVSRAFSLMRNETEDLFSPVTEVAVSPLLRSILDDTVPLAIDVHTEKVRAELIVAPVLLEVWRLTGRRIGFFSGIEFEVAPERGLSGYGSLRC